jgi:hypothetical protein
LENKVLVIKKRTWINSAAEFSLLTRWSVITIAICEILCSMNDKFIIWLITCGSKR